MFARRWRALRPAVSRVTRRDYGVRGEHDSPFDYLPKYRKKPWFNWKTTAVFVALGSYLAYSEVLLEKYAEYTAVDEDDKLLALKLQYKLKQLPIYQKLAHPRNENEWIRLETWENLDHNILDKQGYRTKTRREEAYSTPSLVSHTLAQPGGILIKPVIFHNTKTDEGVTILHVGYRLCGYPFLVHGGILATLLNETFKRNASLSKDTKSNLKGDFKVENLTVSYKYPSLANQFLVIRTRKVPSEDSDDKTIRLESVIESEKGRRLVKATALLHDTGRESSKLKGKSIAEWFKFF